MLVSWVHTAAASNVKDIKQFWLAFNSLTQCIKSEWRGLAADTTPEYRDILGCPRAERALLSGVVLKPIREFA